MNINNGEIIVGENCVTFTVDGDLPLVDENLVAINSSEMVDLILYDNDIKVGGHIISSFKDKQLCYLNRDPFFQSFVTAYCEHRPLILSPDMIWLKILQELSLYINHEPEKFRNFFVDFDGKKQLVIDVDRDIEDSDFDWHRLFDNLIEKININTKGCLIEDLVQEFSTTTSAERIAQQITLLNAVKSYFQIILRHKVCGIPYITLKGTSNDWKAILDRLDILKKFDLDWWVEMLKPILRQFVKTSMGKPDVKFWQKMVAKHRKDELRGGCGYRDMMDGWFVKLFPFDYFYDYGKMCFDFPYGTHMKSEILCVPFVISTEFSGVCHMRDSEFWAGFVGVHEEEDSKSIEPQIGWFVRYKEDAEALAMVYIEEAKDVYNGRPRLRLVIDRVPEFIKYIPEFTELDLEFTGNVEVPDWMDGKVIDRFHVSGKFRRGDKGRLRKRFPRIVI